MVKNTFKGIAWIALYFVVQIIAIIGTIFGYFVYGNTEFTLSSDVDVLAEQIVDFIIKITVPSLILSSIIIIIIFLLYKLIRKHPFDLPKVQSKELYFSGLIGIMLNGIISLILLIINFGLNAIFGNFLDKINTTNTVDMVTTGHPLWVLLLGTGILVPIMEEIVFRYGLCGTIARKNQEAGLIVSSIVFGLMHGNTIQIIYATALGFIMGLIYLKYKNLWYSIAIHIAINSSSVIVASIGKEWIIIISGFLALGGLFLMVNETPELKDFSFIKKEKVIKRLPSLYDIPETEPTEETTVQENEIIKEKTDVEEQCWEEIDEETYDFEKE